jgi:hypothetical protein
MRQLLWGLSGMGARGGGVGQCFTRSCHSHGRWYETQCGCWVLGQICNALPPPMNCPSPECWQRVNFTADLLQQILPTILQPTGAHVHLRTCCLEPASVGSTAVRYWGYSTLPYIVDGGWLNVMFDLTCDLLYRDFDSCDLCLARLSCYHLLNALQRVAGWPLVGGGYEPQQCVLRCVPE